MILPATVLMRLLVSRVRPSSQATLAPPTHHTLRLPCRRFTLPPWLPPTFNGTAARYVYYLQAAVKYRSTAAPPGEAAAVPAGAAAAGQAGSTSVASRAPLYIWPAKPQQLEAVTLERSLSLLAASGSGAAEAAAVPAADGSLLSPPIQSEDMPIKCWEIGPGTAVQDAVAHIIKLVAQPPQAARSHSPGRLAHGNGAGGGADISAGMLAGSVAGTFDDSQSEISHAEQPEEVEMESSASGLAAAAAGGAPPPAAQQQQEQQQGALGSATSSPRSSLLSARRPSLQLPRQETAGAGGVPRSPSLLLPDSGSTLRSYALRCV